MRLQPNADTSHATASEMYEDYGWHTMCQICGKQYVLQTIAYDDIKLSDEELREKVAADVRSDNCDHDGIADEIIGAARRIADDMGDIAEYLDEAIKAYDVGDFAGVVDALDAASSIERNHGDDPDARHLREQLIIDDPELTPHDSASDSPRDIIRAWLADLSDVDPHEIHARDGDSIPSCYAHIWDDSVDGGGGEGYETVGSCLGVEAQVRWMPDGYQPHECWWNVRIWDGETDERLPYSDTDLDDLAGRLAAELKDMEPKKFFVWGHGAAQSTLVRQGKTTNDSGTYMRDHLPSDWMGTEGWCIEVETDDATLDAATRYDNAVEGYAAA